MSSLGISEFEDSLWDDFFRFDQVVPDDGWLECSNDHFPWHDSLRDTLCVVNCNLSHPKNESFSRCAHLGRKQGGSSSLHDKCSSMSDTDSLSCKRSAGFPFSSESDLMDESSSVAFDDTRSSCDAYKINSADSQGGNFPENGTYLGDRRAPVDNQSETTHQESSFNSFGNIDSTDFFSGVSPDIRSFEDVEMMFRSPDSTFGVGVDIDELSWLSPDNDGGVRFEFSCPSSMDANMSEDRDSSESYLADDPVMMSVPIKFEDSSCTLEKSDCDVPFANVPAIADIKDVFIPRDERAGINDTLGHLPDQTSANQPPSAVKSGIEKIEKQHNNQGNRPSVNKSLKDANIMGQTYESGSPSVETQVQLCRDKIEDTFDADGVSVVNQLKLGSSIIQESSTQSLDEISPEAASFCQLQLVMEWLDFKTRLSIRDGLYRLAQGAEQRHNHANLCCSSGSGKTSSGLLFAEETIKWTNFPNMEAVNFARRFPGLLQVGQQTVKQLIFVEEIGWEIWKVITDGKPIMI